MPNPLISIVICSYNRADMLPKTLESAFSQRYEPVEIVVLDDGSTDNTKELMRAYEDKVRYFRQENQGISVARTNACNFAQGKYIAFLDDDDLMPADRITILLDAIKKYPQAVFAVGDLVTIDDNGNFLNRFEWLPKDRLLKEDTVLFDDGYEAVMWPKVPAAVHTTLFRKEDGEKIGWFDRQYRYSSEDKDFFARLGQLGPAVYVPKVVSYYCRGHSSLSNDKMRKLCSRLTFLRNHIDALDPSNSSMRERLKLRILTTLKTLARYKNVGLESYHYDLKDSVKCALVSLDYKDRVKYTFYVLIKLPLRKLFKKRE